jgi:hypothetical protein
VTEAPSNLRQALDVLGFRWPDGDQLQCQGLAIVWKAFADDVSAIQRDIDRHVNDLVSDQEGSIKAVRDWWNKPDGSNANLGLTVQAANNSAVAANGMGAIVSGMQAETIVESGLMAAALLASGGLLTVFIAWVKRRILWILIGMIATAIGAYLVYEHLLEGPRPKVVDPPAGPYGGPRTAPTPYPTTAPDTEPRGQATPDVYYPTDTTTTQKDQPPPPCSLSPRVSYQAVFFHPGLSARTSYNTIPAGAEVDHTINGDGIAWVGAQRQRDGSIRTSIYGVVKPTSGRSDDDVWPATAQSIGLQPNWDGAHLFGPGWGTEAKAGMLLAPRSVNRGGQEGIEGYIANLSDLAQSRGGHVEVLATAQSHPPGAYYEQRGGYNYPKGDLLLRQTDYEVNLCLPDPRDRSNVILARRENYVVVIGQPPANGDSYQTPSTVTSVPRRPVLPPGW